MGYGLRRSIRIVEGETSMRRFVNFVKKAFGLRSRAQRRASLACCALIVVSMPAFAVYVPPVIPWSPGTIYFDYYYIDGSLNYDSETDRLVSFNQHVFSYYLSSWGQPTLFNGIWLLQASISEDFVITDSGSVTLLGDLGNGLELLMSGSVRRIGFSENYTESAIDAEGADFVGVRFMQIAFGIDFLHEFLTDTFSKYAAFIAGVEIGDWLGDGPPGSYPSPFQQSFDCAIEYRCTQFSGDYGIVPLSRISEPGVLWLLGAGLLLLSRVRRRQAKP
jgi:hypothetical protein